MNYRIDEEQGVAIVRVEEERATIAEGVDELKKALIGLFDQGQYRAIVDLSRVTFADSSMLGALVSALKVAARKRGDVKLVGLQPPVRAIFELTRLYRVFEIFDTKEDALASF